jgi:hypothetical protein
VIAATNLTTRRGKPLVNDDGAPVCGDAFCSTQASYVIFSARPGGLGGAVQRCSLHMATRAIAEQQPTRLAWMPVRIAGPGSRT